MKALRTVFLRNVAPQSSFIDEYLINTKHSENVLHLCLAEVNDTGITRDSICYS